jgi:TPR repeat protein
MLQKLSTADVSSVCANCGKEGNDVNNICNKCKQAKYCNAACKKKHRHKHKKECDEHTRQVAELHDKELFKQREDCPICFERSPTLITGSKYNSCCGKTICNGCVYAPLYDNQGNEVDNKKCPYCRTPFPESEKEAVKRTMKRMEANDAEAINNLGCYYRDGNHGFPQDYTKAFKLFLRAGELGYSMAYGSIGYAYQHGEGVEVDKKKAIHYWELAAMGGNVQSRHNLGVMEMEAGNTERASKHHTIAVRDGHADSLMEIKQLYLNGHATKEDYTKALKAYQDYLVEIKSVQRDKAAAVEDQCRYY